MKTFTQRYFENTSLKLPNAICARHSFKALTAAALLFTISVSMPAMAFQTRFVSQNFQLNGRTDKKHQKDHSPISGDFELSAPEATITVNTIWITNQTVV